MSATDLADLREATAQWDAKKLRAIDAVDAAAMAVESALLLTAIDDYMNLFGSAARPHAFLTVAQKCARSHAEAVWRTCGRASRRPSRRPLRRRRIGVYESRHA